ncbi:unnamed protein product (macronuclear) [Paramecium tetraurelia]|uniref:Uncharacterized protein n=1 Tax=Paramecium tetraurelia TaxID=5888 RepID=A0E4A8_PARTE|nr:uncharacterized protein GSPATT00023299001 [Paramecium tetraurelia]CAK90125.1 unnamed protein product [Paramecium tetraurelia]|eukprot:XP_001457522.1 hypothetical protein (macronuclear) [Paramecium tetraurelia strain d4-2]
MQASPLIKVQSSAFSTGSALRIKQKQSQPQNQVEQISPLKYLEENEQSPSKIINIYADSAFYNSHTAFSEIQNQQISEDDRILKSYTYSQMAPDDAEKAYCERQKTIQDQIKRSKDNAKNKKKEFYESKKRAVKSGTQKQQINSSITQSQLIDISRGSQHFRRTSIDQVPQPKNKLIKNQVSQSNQSFHLQFQSKKQQLLNDIAKLEKEIVVEQQYIQLASKKIQPRQNLQATKTNYEKRQSTKKFAKSETVIQEKKSIKTKNTLKNLNTSQNSQISPQTSPKSTLEVKSPIRSQSQEAKEIVDLLRQSREDLNCIIFIIIHLREIAQNE